MEHDNRLEGYVSTYSQLVKRTESEQAAIAILIELGKDRRAARMNDNGHSHNGDCLATEKPKTLLDKLNADYDKRISKRDACRLIDQALAKGNLGGGQPFVTALLHESRWQPADMIESRLRAVWYGAHGSL